LGEAVAKVARGGRRKLGISARTPVALESSRVPAAKHRKKASTYSAGMVALISTAVSPSGRARTQVLTGHRGQHPGLAGRLRRLRAVSLMSALPHGRGWRG